MRIQNRPAPAFASLFAPSGRRKWWWYTYRCRQCGTHQFGRGRTLEDVAGIRRASCGHQVSVLIARTYGQRP